ncbi:MAG: metabolite traffic protein EboE [Mariniblastus sp.]
MKIGYCGNVHPGKTLEEVKQNLVKHSLDVKSKFSPNEPLGIGLWLSATTANQLEHPETCLQFRDWLLEHELVPYTLNGFPFGDFHQEVVKHDVYLPTWADFDRLQYTNQLAKILNVLLPEGQNGTISTLPLGWPLPEGTPQTQVSDFFRHCATNIQKCAEHLDRISQTDGRNLFVCLEPEPGCVLDKCEDVIQFFDEHLTNQGSKATDIIRSHIGVCHDVCHSAVMFESQAKAIEQYCNAKIKVGKVQVSSAVEVNFDDSTPILNREKLEQLARFAEPKYLHQTVIRSDTETLFFEDLTDALNSAGTSPQGCWRVHFHVPIFTEAVDQISTTQFDIENCLDSIQSFCQESPHFEVETYAWNVLPHEMQSQTLAEGIAKELSWFDNLINRRNQQLSNIEN